MSKKITLLLIAVLTVFGSLALDAQTRIAKQVIGSGGAVGLKNSSKQEMSGVAGQVAIFNTTNVVNSVNITAYQGFWTPDSLLIWNWLGVEDEIANQNNATNFPNPFVNMTTIRYELPAPGNVKLRVYDLSGNLVKILFEGFQDAGIQNIQWNAKDELGTDVSSGSYVYEVTAVPAGGSYFEAFRVKNMMIIAK
jgi:hypothetical protein